jgi:4-hydroxy-3-polyprenylbenzoate decarboxylase
MEQLPIIVAITGASGAIYGVKTLKALKALNIPTILLISQAATITIKLELDLAVEDIISLATKYYNYKDITASICSGSVKTQGMIIAPCSSKSLAAIACGIEDNLIARAASVTLKERRKFVAVFRETPLHLAHIENMAKVTHMGGIIFPPVPAFYNNPNSIEDLVDYTIERVLDQFNIEINNRPRWGDV